MNAYSCPFNHRFCQSKYNGSYSESLMSILPLEFGGDEAFELGSIGVIKLFR